MTLLAQTRRRVGATRVTRRNDGGGDAGPGVPGLEFEAGQVGQEVELGRPDVAVRAAKELCQLAFIESEVVGDNALVQDVVGVQGDVSGLGEPYRGLLTRR